MSSLNRERAAADPIGRRDSDFKSAAPNAFPNLAELWRQYPLSTIISFALNFKVCVSEVTSSCPAELIDTLMFESAIFEKLVPPSVLFWMYMFSVSVPPPTVLVY